MAKILLVEDDDTLRDIYETRLMAEGYDIVTARDGEDALVVAKNNKPDLIISDVMMPNISGFDMLDILRNTQGLTDAKVIMLTALSQSEDKARAEKLGADRYLVKSQVTLEDIVNTAAELLGLTPEPEVTPEPTTPAPTPELSLPPAQVPVEQVPAMPVVEPVAPAYQSAPAQVPAPEQPQVQVPVVAAPIATEPVTTLPQPLSEPAYQPQQPATSQADQPEPAYVTPPPVIPPIDPVQTPQPPIVQTPVVEPPEEEEQQQPAVISMPNPTDPIATPAPTPNTTIDTPVTPTVAEPTVEPEQSPEPTPTPAFTQPEQTPEPEATVAQVEEQPAAPTPIDVGAIDTSSAQTASSEGAVIKQQIDDFVNNAPVSTPEFSPSAFDVSENNDDTSEESAAPVEPQISAPPAAEPTPQPEAPVFQPAPEIAQPSSPLPQPQQPSIIQPSQSAVTPTQPAGEAPAPSAEPRPQQAPAAAPHIPTGGNKVIQPIMAPVSGEASLDELLAKEQAATDAISAATGIQRPANPPQQQMVNPASMPVQQHTTVFDPDDPSSVAL